MYFEKKDGDASNQNAAMDAKIQIDVEIKKVKIKLYLYVLFSESRFMITILILESIVQLN